MSSWPCRIPKKKNRVTLVDEIRPLNSFSSQSQKYLEQLVAEEDVAFYGSDVNGRNRGRFCSDCCNVHY